MAQALSYQTMFNDVSRKLNEANHKFTLDGDERKLEAIKSIETLRPHIEQILTQNLNNIYRAMFDKLKADADLALENMRRGMKKKVQVQPEEKDTD